VLVFTGPPRAARRRARLKVLDVVVLQEHEAFESRDAGQAMRRTNALLRDKQYAAALSARNAVAMLGWKIAPHYSAIARLEAAVALNLAASLHAVGFHRYRVCQASPCRDVFVDLSKNGSRIFCGPRCATRVHVARFRGREQ
jgi:predicted RNA-binding Zn ribbon-like protein